MSKKIDPEFYERGCFAEDLAEAKKNNELLRPHGRKNAIEVMRYDIMNRRKYLKKLEKGMRRAKKHYDKLN